jgi:hypothetical protein
MTAVDGELYVALRAARVPDELARPAAATVAQLRDLAIRLEQLPLGTVAEVPVLL